jgi:uncharacterized delta-60 repeat protein
VKVRTALPLIPVLLALCAVSVPARAASSHGRLDRSFGHSGIATVAAPKADDLIEGFTIAPGGRVYVLDGSLLLAFQSNGKVARNFGEDGQVTVAPAVGEGEPAGLAVDSLGRLLVTGSTYLQNQRAYTAYVIRLLPSGSRDVSFGSGGEVDTHFGLPAPAGHKGLSLEATSIIVDVQNRLVVAGSFGKAAESCGYTIGSGPDPFVGRLTASGAIDKTFAGVGHAVLKGPGGVTSLAQLPGGGAAVFTTPCSTTPCSTTPCSTPPRFEWRSPYFSALTESGEASPFATERPLGFTYQAPAIDSNGRVLELESPPPAAEGADALARYLPSGDPDPGFGRRGRVVLRRGSRWASAFAVDAQDRPIIAVAARKIELRRFLPDGKIDMGFGPRGRLTAKSTAPSAIALDARGRIYTVSLARNQSQTTVRVVRFIPGR